MSDSDTDDDETKYIQRIVDFVRIEKEITDSSESSDESSEDDSDENSDRKTPDQSKPGKRRLSCDDPSSDAQLTPKNAENPQQNNSGNIKIKRFINKSGAEEYAVQDLPEKSETPKYVENFPRRKPGPLSKTRPKPKLICRLDRKSIDLPPTAEKKDSGNTTPVPIQDISAVTPSRMEVSEETDDENYLLDEEKILGLFQGECNIGSTADETEHLSGENAQREESKDACRSPKNEENDVSQRNSSREKEVSVRKKKPQSESGSSSEEQNSQKFKSAKSVEKKTDIVSKVGNDFKLRKSGKSQNVSRSSPSSSPKTDNKPNKLATWERLFEPDLNRKQLFEPDTNRKKLLKGPKSRQNPTGTPRPEKKSDVKIQKTKNPKKNAFVLENFVLPSPKSLNRIPLKQEVLLARSQKNSKLRLASPQKVPLKDSSKSPKKIGGSEKTSKPQNKEAINETNPKQSPRDAPLASTNEKAPSQPQARNCGPSENGLRPPLKESTCHEDNICRKSTTTELQSSLDVNEPATESRSIPRKNSSLQQELFSRPVRPDRRSSSTENKPYRPSNEGSRPLSPLSDFASRRSTPTRSSESENTLSKLGLPNCEDKGDPCPILSNTPASKSPESALTQRLSRVALPSTNLSVEVLTEIAIALNPI